MLSYKMASSPDFYWICEDCRTLNDFTDNTCFRCFNVVDHSYKLENKVQYSNEFESRLKKDATVPEKNDTNATTTTTTTDTTTIATTIEHNSNSKNSMVEYLSLEDLSLEDLTTSTIIEHHQESKLDNEELSPILKDLSLNNDSTFENEPMEIDD